MKERPSWYAEAFFSFQYLKEEREMLYLGVDQHCKQLTVRLRNEGGT